MTIRTLRLCAGLATLGLMTAISAPAHASTIISPVSATYQSGDPGCCDASKLVDKSGLTTLFEDGVTDFDAYLALDPKHLLLLGDLNILPHGAGGVATVDLDLGAKYSVDKIAIWSKDAGLISNIDIYGSLDGNDYFLLSTFKPVAKLLALDYGANVSVFAETFLRYVRLDVSACIGLLGIVSTCNIGEIILGGHSYDTSEVPLPAALPLFAAGLAGLGFARRRQRT